MTMVSVVLETDSIHAFDTLTLEDCLDALARQDYPADRIHLVAVDGGKAPRLAEAVAARFPSATVLPCPGASKFEQKNLGIRAARGEIVALLDADCAAPPNWISTVVEELGSAPPDVAGVQGVTELSPGFLSREMSALLYGVRKLGPRGDASRLVTDNVAFRLEVVRRFGFEHPSFSTAVDSLLLHRLRRAGYRVRLSERLRMIHSYPATLRVGLPWFLLRAWAVGYFMIRTRQHEPALRGGRLVRRTGIGWPALVSAKAANDLAQVVDHRRRVGAHLLRALPLIAVFETTLFLGGIAALLGLPAPRVS